MNNPSQRADSGHDSQTLRVVLLGPLRLSLLAEACVIPFPRCGSQEAMWSSLLNVFPPLQAMRSAIRLVRNNEFLLADERLEPGDEVALVPPVSGG